MEELLDHFSHNHPLILLCHDHDHDHEEGKLDEEVVCSGCCLPLVSGNSVYSCTLHCNFFLHKSCAELPRGIHLPYLHPTHPLILFPEIPYDGGKAGCDDCGKEFTGFMYSCPDCNFDIDITCASSQLENIVRREGHQHSFVLLRPTSFGCHACGDGRLRRSNTCTICNLQVHEECAKLPLTIKQMSKTHDHQLSLTYFSQLGDEPPPAVTECKICDYLILADYWFYYCGGCSYICHVGCALSLEYDDQSQEKNQLLMPIPYSFKLGSTTCTVKALEGHRHSFMVVRVPSFTCDACGEEEKGSRNLIRSILCTICQLQVHQECAKLPLTIKEMSRTHDHQLSLTYYSQLDDEPAADNVCKICYKKINKKFWFYYCGGCSYVCHVLCPLSLEYDGSQENNQLLMPIPYSLELGSTTCAVKALEGHRHSFMVAMVLSFTCEACGEEKDGSRSLIRSILCTICQLQVHEECAKLPLTIKQISTTLDHQLSLTCYSQLDDKPAANHICEICYEKIKKDFWFYYCGGCSYVCHVRCASSVEYDASQEKNQLLMPIPYCRELGSTTCTVKEIRPEKTLLTNQLEHFGLPYCFTLHFSNDELIKGDEVICDGCVLPILSSPFYTCAESKFFLHKACRELPDEILHPGHEHSLTLLAKVEKKTKRTHHRIGVFECSGCRIDGNGFAYACTKCDFYLDVRCSSLSGTLKHEAHECSLTLNIDIDLLAYMETSSCDACRRDSHAMFSCKGCRFDIDWYCASLPYATTHECPKHNWELHPFLLTYKTDAHVTGEYYCDMCEEQRGQNDWFYYCKDCDYSGHPLCVVRKNNFIKFGKAYKIEEIHHHLITFVEIKTKMEYHSCAHCGDPCEDWALKCFECNIYFHASACGKESE